MKFYHRLGPKTYDDARKEWVDTVLYPNQSLTTSSTATSASVNTPAGDRVPDWYSVLHTRDSSGKFTITDPGTKKVADNMVSFEIINYMLDFFYIWALIYYKLIVIHVTFYLNR